MEQNTVSFAENVSLAEHTGGGELELYLHIPFCIRKCHYCDFLSAPADEETRAAYCEALRKELRGRAREAEGFRVISVFVGGGTPSVLEPRQVTELFETIRKYYRLTDNAEITMEVNPGTLDGKKLTAYRAAGVNRLSIGLQSAREEELRTLGRIHSFRQFLESYQLAREAGFANINVDLISSLPGQTAEAWRETLRSVLMLSPAPEHLSAYSLIVEEGTPFYEQYQKGVLKLPSEEEDREMYHLTGRLLKEAGYERYEISNYAKKGFACQHNMGYWQRKNYLGFGIGAASLMENVRFSNDRDLKRYLAAPLDVRGEKEELDRREQMEETMFLGLRMREGVRFSRFAENFGCRLEEVYGEVLEKNRRDGLLAWDEKRVFLTEKGIDLSNYVMAQFLRDV